MMEATHWGTPKLTHSGGSLLARSKKEAICLLISLAEPSREAQET